MVTMGRSGFAFGTILGVYRSAFGAGGSSAKRLGGAALLVLAALPWLAIAGCGGGSSGTTIGPTPRCVRASDCSGLLICVQGF